MKKFFITFLLFAGMAGSTIFAAGGSPKAEEALKKEFSGASSIKWEYLKKASIYHACFIYHDEFMHAFFSDDGELIATGRFIPISNLPFLASREISSKYQGYQINDVTEYTRESETGYLVNMENEKSKLAVQVYPNGASFVFKKEKKNLSK